MSGSVENYWSLSKDDNHLEYAYKIAEELNATANSFDELVIFLKNVSADELHSYTLLEKNDDLFEIIFGPVIESEFKVLDVINSQSQRILK